MGSLKTALAAQTGEQTAIIAGRIRTEGARIAAEMLVATIRGETS